jgi:hypothetical protein
MLLYMSADVILALVHLQANAITTCTPVSLASWRLFGESPRTRVDTEWTFWGNLVETPFPRWTSTVGKRDNNIGAN